MSTSGTAGTLPRRRPETGRQIARFLVVGGASVAVDLAAYALLTSLTPLSWSASKGASYAAGVVVGFFGNKFWTFQSRRRSAAEPALYLLLYALTLLLNIACNQLALAALGPQFKLVAFLFATGVTTVTNFLGMKLFAFRRGIEERQRIARSHSPRASASGDAPRPDSAFTTQSVAARVPTQSVGTSE